ncbi:MAG: hypothetical protein O3B01_28060 [Planctomycetota bacterium]|nr:hypothetical protein [Planctomycetota bacterium]
MFPDSWQEAVDSLMVPELPFCMHAPLYDPGGVPGARLFAHRGLLPSGQLGAVGFHPPLQDGFSSWTTTMLFSRLCYAAYILATPGFTVLEIDGRAQTRLEPLLQHLASVLATT